MSRLLLLCALVLAPQASGQAPCELVKLLASDPDDDDRFGFSVSLSGDHAAVGAFKHDDQGLNSGAVYVFARSGTVWAQQAELLASDGQSQDRFGWDVALTGTQLVVGAREDDDQGANAGSAYVFRQTGTSWGEVAKLVAFDGQPGDDFGHAVATAGNLIVVGAEAGAGGGAAYVFRDFGGDSWVFEAKLVGLDTAPRDQFGFDVAIDGDTILCGAALESQGGTSAGATYVFRDTHGAWFQELKLLADDASSNDRFGSAVDIDGDRALIGAFGDSAPLSVSGSAYVFERVGTQWSQAQKLTASDGNIADAFGWSVALAGNRALIGARLDDEAGTDAGAGYAFRFDGSTWTEAAKVLGSDTEAGDEFGYALALDGSTGLIGAWAEDTAEDEAGAIYLFAGVGDPDCNGNGNADSCDLAAGLSVDIGGDGIPDECQTTTYCTAKTNSAGCVPQVTAVGVPSAGGPGPFQVSATMVLNNKNGLWFYGINGAVAVPFLGGVLCAAPPLKRTPIQNSTGNPPPSDCSGSYAFDFNAWIQGGFAPNLVPGATAHGQFWSRDPLASSGVGLTDAVECTVGP